MAISAEERKEFVKWFNKNYYVCEEGCYPYDDDLPPNPWQAWCWKQVDMNNIDYAIYFDKVESHINEWYFWIGDDE